MWPILIGAGVIMAYVYYRNSKTDAAAGKTGNDLNTNPGDVAVSPADSAAVTAPSRLVGVASRTPRPAPGVEPSAVLVSPDSGERTTVGDTSLVAASLPVEPTGEPVGTKTIVRQVDSLSRTDVKTAVDTIAQRATGSGDALADVSPQMSTLATAQGGGLKEVETGVLDTALGVPKVDNQGPGALVDTTAAIENADSFTDPDPFIG